MTRNRTPYARQSASLQTASRGILLGMVTHHVSRSTTYLVPSRSSFPAITYLVPSRIWFAEAAGHNQACSACVRPSVRPSVRVLRPSVCVFVRVCVCPSVRVCVCVFTLHGLN